MAVDDEDEEWDAAMKRAAEANESDTAQFGLLDLADAMPGAGTPSPHQHSARLVCRSSLLDRGSALAVLSRQSGPSGSEVEDEEAPAISTINAPRCTTTST